MGEGAQQLLLRLLLDALPYPGSSSPALAVTLLQEIRCRCTAFISLSKRSKSINDILLLPCMYMLSSFVVLLLGEGAAPHAGLIADAIPRLLDGGSDIHVPHTSLVGLSLRWNVT